MRRVGVVLAAVAALVCLVMPLVASAETVKARVLDVNERRSEVRVDVAGQGRTYRVNIPSLYRVLRQGRLVVITTELVNGRHTIVDAQRAEQQGRIVRLDERRGSASIQDSDDRSTDTYFFDDTSGLRRLREGDSIRFDVEERGMRRIITRWSPLGGGGGSGGWGGGGGGGWGGGGADTQRDAGRVVDVDHRRTQLTIELSGSGRRQTFDVVERRLLDGLRVNDSIRFEWERRGSGRGVIVDIR